ncbi:MAG: hypothetical protein ACFFBV_11835 [Promethearchaeota archaeon]
MKKVMYIIQVAFLIITMIACTQIIKGKTEPTVVMDTPNVELSKKAQVVIRGTGFKPGQEVVLVFTAIDGVKSDIDYALKPKPIADQTGAWTTTWSCGRYIGKKLIKEGEYTITATDKEYNFITDTTVRFYAGKKSK